LGAIPASANARVRVRFLRKHGRALRDCKPLSLLLIDADLFKSYNDTYGHLRGDGCLKQIAEAAQDVVARSGDLVARFGGEEFAIVLPNTCNSGALQLAQDVCSVMRNRELAHSANPVGVVTVSIGCATLIPQQGQHVATLIDCADQALYEAKNAGRNRAVAFRCTADALDEGRNSGNLLPLESA
jgi:diguanylate cyclase (GGDEF)-like protein